MELFSRRSVSLAVESGGGDSTKNGENRREGLLLDIARGESFGYQSWPSWQALKAEDG